VDKKHLQVMQKMQAGMHTVVSVKELILSFGFEHVLPSLFP
jgi:hypothetical protein